MTFTHPEGFSLKCCLLHGNLTSVKLERLPNTHADNNKACGRDWRPDGEEFLIEKASSFQEFAAEEMQHNKVIKKGLCDVTGLSQGCHTPTHLSLHKQIIFLSPLTVCEKFDKRNKIPKITIAVLNSPIYFLLHLIFCVSKHLSCRSVSEQIVRNFSSESNKVLVSAATLT